MRNYAVATFLMDAWRDGYKVPECFAFFGIGTQEECTDLGLLLDIAPRPWIKVREWVVAFDMVALACVDFIGEVNAKRWELEQLGVTYTWITELIPEAPAESMDGAFMNTFASEEEFNRSLLAPIDMRDALHQSPNLRPLHIDGHDLLSRNGDLPDAANAGRLVSQPVLRAPVEG